MALGTKNLRSSGSISNMVIDLPMSLPLLQGQQAEKHPQRERFAKVPSFSPLPSGKLKAPRQASEISNMSLLNEKSKSRFSRFKGRTIDGRIGKDWSIKETNDLLLKRLFGQTPMKQQPKMLNPLEQQNRNQQQEYIKKFHNSSAKLQQQIMNY